MQERSVEPDITGEQVLWGAASMLLKRHGEDAPALVAERIGALLLEGDELGCAVYKEIARCMDQLMSAGSVH